MTSILLAVCFGILFGQAIGWDYTDDVDREWNVQTARRIPEISKEQYLEKSKKLAGVSAWFSSDYQILAMAVNSQRLSLKLALQMTKNMTSYGETVIKVTEDDFNAAYAAFSASEKVFQTVYNELTQAERAEVDAMVEKAENERSRRHESLPKDGARSRRDTILPEDDEAGFRSVYNSLTNAADNDTDTTDVYTSTTEKPPQYDQRLWPAMAREELVRRIVLKNSADSLREILKGAYQLREVFVLAEEELKKNRTIMNLVQGTEALMQFLTVTDTRALVNYIGLHYFATFTDPDNVYPTRRDDPYSLRYKLIQSQIYARSLGMSFYPVKYWQDYILIDTHDADCSDNNTALSVVDCPLSYLKKHGVTVIDVQKFHPWLKTFNRARRIRVNQIGVSLGGTLLENINGTNREVDRNLTLEVFNVGMCTDYFFFDEYPFMGPPAHLKYVYDQKNLNKRQLHPISSPDEGYSTQSTPFTKWLIVFDKTLNPDLDLSEITSLHISWNGEASLNPYP